MYKKIFLSVLIVAGILIINSANATSTSCTDLSYSLKQGMRDAQTAGNVTKLQTYLQQANYLSTSPSGYFGAMTLKAVQKFQSDNGVSSTGYVGPATKAMLKNLSCNTTAVQPTINPGTSSVPSQNPAVASCSVKITAPSGASTSAARRTAAAPMPMA